MTASYGEAGGHGQPKMVESGAAATSHDGPQPPSCARIIDSYARAAARLIPAFEAIASADVLGPVLDYLEIGFGRLLEIGAGSGRDASWFAARGHDVVAVEPVAPFREAGVRLHDAERIEWIDDSLPLLRRTLQRGRVFDRILLVAVWQHVAPDQRQNAFRCLRRLLAPGGRMIMSVRHGPGAPGRPCFSAPDADTIGLACQADFVLLARRSAQSVQQGNRDAGVTWTWLVYAGR